MAIVGTHAPIIFPACTLIASGVKVNNSGCKMLLGRANAAKEAALPLIPAPIMLLAEAEIDGALSGPALRDLEN